MKAGLIILIMYAGLLAKSQQVHEHGYASYYADKFSGRKCTSGEIFRQDAFTAAHKTLKFGTLVKVINLLNDSFVIVRINDRLPRSSKRCIDLTKSAARQLNYLQKGLVKVRIEVLKDSLP